MKIKFAMMVGACVFALWGCGSDDGVDKPDVSVVTDSGSDSAKTDGGSDALKVDGGADALPVDALKVGDTSPADAPQLLDTGAKETGTTDVPQGLDAAGDVSADSEVRG